MKVSLGVLSLALSMAAPLCVLADDPLPLPRPMDLVSNVPPDPNGIPRNPKWGLQHTMPGVLPDPVELCLDEPGLFDNPVCTVQQPTIDRPVGVKRAICGVGGTTPISGHVNWFAASYEGPLYWHGKFWSDQDVNVSLVPPDQSGLTTGAPEAILTEFDARETLNHFATPWWTDLRRAATLGAKDRGRTLVDGRKGILVGLLGLDCEHGCGSEMHPVWAMAIQAKAEAKRETWAIFARNWGNEGFCSSAQHELQLADDRLTVSVPWRAGATRVRLGRGTKFLANVAGITAWWTAVAGEAVYVTFQLPGPQQQGRVHGELALVWSGAPEAPEPPAPAGRIAREETDGPEYLVEELVAGMPTRQRLALEAREPRAHLALDAVPVPLERRPPTSPARAAALRPPVSARLDPQRDQDDLRRLRMLVEVYGATMPGALSELPRLLEPR